MTSYWLRRSYIRSYTRDFPLQTGCVRVYHLQADRSDLKFVWAAPLLILCYLFLSFVWTCRGTMKMLSESGHHWCVCLFRTIWLTLRWSLFKHKVKYLTHNILIVNMRKKKAIPALQGLHTVWTVLQQGNMFLFSYKNN